jgi:hypothetical protein
MPTSKEYRHRAEECLRLANETKESFARMGLLELAAEFRSKAQQLEFASAGLILGSAFALPLFIFVRERSQTQSATPTRLPLASVATTAGQA